jgi:hypothetical protein
LFPSPLFWERPHYSRVFSRHVEPHLLIRFRHYAQSKANAVCYTSRKDAKQFHLATR